MRTTISPICARGLGLAVLLTLAACGTAPPKSGNVSMPHGGKVKIPVRQDPTLPALPAAGSGRGGYYKDDGPGDNPPANLRDVPDAEVRNEPYSTRSNRPYVVFGKTYTPMTDNEPFTQRGTGTWYGKKFHGQRTSSGEIYDMYKMTAAHPTLPIPSYARLTDIISGKQVIVRINDRGPFHSKRIVDVSYTAALKLGMLAKGSHELLLERILPEEIERMRAAQSAAPEMVVGVTQTAGTSAAGVALAGAPEVAAPLAATPAAAAPQVATPPAPAPALQTAAENAPAALNSGVYLQLGAYTQPDNANNALAKFKPYAGRMAMFSVVQSELIYRLYSGPYASRAEAASAAQLLPAALGVKPLVVER